MSETTGPAPGSRFTWSGLARRAWIVVLLLVIGTALGFLGARQQPATYTATATVLVEPADGNPYEPGTRGQNLANLGTEAQLVSSDAVAQLAKATLRSDASIAALVEQLTVNTPPNSQVLEVSYTDITPVAARNGANAFADAYLVARAKRASDSVQAQINNLTKARTSNQSALQRSVAALSKTTPGTPAHALANQRVQVATAEAAKLESKISDLRLFQGDPGQVLSPATSPTRTAGLPGWILPAAGAALGLLLGLSFAIWRSLNDSRLRTVDDVKALGYPVLSTVRATAHGNPGELLTDSEAELPEGVRLLRSVLAVSSPDGGKVLLLPAGPVTPHVATPLALAAALARADQPVALVDVDGELTQAAKLADIDGVAEVLSDLTETSAVAKEYQDNLRFIPTGIRHSGSVDKLASPQMRDFLDQLAPDSRWLLVAGPIATAPETLTLTDLCGDVVILVSLRQTTAAELQEAVEAVQRGGGNLLGVVVDGPLRTGRLQGARRAAPAGPLDEVLPAPKRLPVDAASTTRTASDERRPDEPEAAPDGRPNRWFADVDTEDGDETDLAGSRRSM